MRQDVLTAALAGLLHDIGKLAQRADAPMREAMDKDTRREVRYEHALAGYSFVQDAACALPEDVKKGLSAVAYHHVPQTVWDQRVQLADWMSAGERDETDGSADDRRVPFLRTVFGVMAGYDRPWYWPLHELRLDDGAIFPHQIGGKPDADDSRAQYHRLWEGFVRESRPLRDISDPRLFLERIYNLMFRFTWCVPSAYYNAVPDVSLFDHCRTTAALAATLTVDERDQSWCKNAGDEEPLALLVAGDVNGVQDFIYSLASTGAAKTLRGRSFYVQMLTEVVAEYVLGQLGLPLTNTIYVGGGNFYLLAGVTQDVALRQVRTEVTRRLVAAHHGALHLTMAWTPVRRREFRCHEFSSVWRRLHEEQMLPAKHRPLSGLPDQELFALVGDVLGSGGDDSNRCSICDAERAPGENLHKPGDEDIRKCDLCQSFEDLGRLLTYATHLVWETVEPASVEDAGAVRSWQQGLESFGAMISVLDGTGARKTGPEYRPPSSGSLVRISRLNHGDAGLPVWAPKDCRVVDMVRPAGQLVPRDEGERRALTTKELAEKSGFKRWGVLRMDVDNLGDLFARGFDGKTGNRLTLSRVASLSLAFRLFFEGMLPNLLAAESAPVQDRLKDRLYLQYAGGDDVFVIGNWEALPVFAEIVRRRFGEFVAHNPSVTLSAGISLADEGYPLYQAAREAQEAENAAKNLRTRKDAISFLGQAVPWEDFGPVMERAQELSSWCSQKRVARSLLQTLLSIDADYRRWNRDGKPFFGPWMWVLAYQLTRTAAQAKDTDVKDGIIEMRDALPVPGGLITTIGLAARWAELLCRRGGDGR